MAGQAGAWIPIGAAAITNGYEVAWKFTGADQYTVWDTDANGNYLSSPIGVVSGSSAALRSLEPSFNQDLNGDGVIGVPTATKAATSTVTANSNPLSEIAHFAGAAADGFVFNTAVRSGEASDSIAAGASPPGSMRAAFFDQSLPEQLQALFHSTSGTNPTVVDPVIHEGTNLANVQTSHLHLSDFIVH